MRTQTHIHICICKHTDLCLHTQLHTCTRTQQVSFQPGQMQFDPSLAGGGGGRWTAREDADLRDNYESFKEARTHIHTHTYAHAHVHAHVHAHAHTLTRIHTHTLTHTHTHTQDYAVYDILADLLPGRNAAAIQRRLKVTTVEQQC
jgi:hypothetical protein